MNASQKVNQVENVIFY